MNELIKTIKVNTNITVPVFDTYNILKNVVYSLKKNTIYIVKQIRSKENTYYFEIAPGCKIWLSGMYFDIFSTSPTPTLNNTPEEINTYLLSLQTANERLAFLNTITQGICRDCGNLWDKCICPDHFG